MLNTILRKRAQLLVMILVISMLMIATTSFAATKLIKARTGGVLRIDNGVRLRIPPRALKEDTVISADILREEDRIVFDFTPDGLIFARPARLRIGWSVVMEMDDFIMRGPDGEKIWPRVRWWGLEYKIRHFSLYYFRRR